MRAGADRAAAWLAAPAPPERLAVLRILTGLFAVVYLLARLDAYLDAIELGDGTFDPVGVLAWLDAPLSAAFVTSLLVATLVLGLAYIAGVEFRFTGPAFAAGLLFVTTYRSSGGRLLYFENLVVLHVLIVGCAPAADAFALRRAPARRRDGAAYGWPLRLAALVTVTTYVLAGVAKLRIGGSAWLSGESLRNHIAYSAARLEVLGASASPLAAPLTRSAWFSAPLTILTLVLELGAPLALAGRRRRNVWVAATWCFHLGVAAAMFVVFPYPLALVAFGPMFELEVLWARVVGRIRRR